MILSFLCEQQRMTMLQHQGSSLTAKKVSACRNNRQLLIPAKRAPEWRGFRLLESLLIHSFIKYFSSTECIFLQPSFEEKYIHVPFFSMRNPQLPWARHLAYFRGVKLGSVSSTNESCV